MRGFVIKQEKHLSALKKQKTKKNTQQGLCLCAAVADGWTSAGNPEQEVTRWDRDREKAHVQELGSVWTWLPAEGTQTSEQGRGTSWERNLLKLSVGMEHCSCFVINRLSVNWGVQGDLGVSKRL